MITPAMFTDPGHLWSPIESLENLFQKKLRIAGMKKNFQEAIMTKSCIKLAE